MPGSSGTLEVNTHKRRLRCITRGRRGALTSSPCELASRMQRGATAIDRVQADLACSERGRLPSREQVSGPYGARPPTPRGSPRVACVSRATLAESPGDADEPQEAT